MIRALDKIKSLEEYEEDKKLLTYYLSEYKWFSESENPKLEIEETIKGLSDQLHEGMDYEKELNLLEKIHTLKTKYISIIRGNYQSSLRRNITGLVLMMEQFEAANENISAWELAKGILTGNQGAKDNFRKKYMFNLTNMFGIAQAPESLNVESMEDILDYMAKNYDLVDIDLSDRKMSNEELSLVILEEPIVGLKAKASQNANKVTEKCITEFLDSSESKDEKVKKEGKQSNDKVQIKRAFNNQEHGTAKNSYEERLDRGEFGK